MKKIEKVLMWIAVSYWRLFLLWIILVALIQHVVIGDLKGAPLSFFWVATLLVAYAMVNFLEKNYHEPALNFPFIEKKVGVLGTFIRNGYYGDAVDLMQDMLNGEGAWSNFFTKGIYVRYFFMEFKDALRATFKASQERNPRITDLMVLDLANDLDDAFDRIEDEDHSWFRTEVLTDLAFHRDRFVHEILVPRRESIEGQFAEKVHDYISYRGSALVNLHSLILSYEEHARIINAYLVSTDKEGLKRSLVFILKNPNVVDDLVDYLKACYPGELEDIDDIDLTTYDAEGNEI